VLWEVLLVCTLSMGISLILVELLRPGLNQWFGIEFRMYYTEPGVAFSLLLVLAACLTVSGLFISLFLFSRNTTMEILQERTQVSGMQIFKVLLVLQVIVVVILVAGTLTVNKQIRYVLSRPLGFQKEHIVVLHLKDLSEDPAPFIADLENLSPVRSVGMTSQHFGYPAQGFSLENLGLEGTAEFMFANYAYLQTLEIPLVHNWIHPEADTIRGMVVNRHLYERLMERHGSMEALMTYQESQTLREGMEHITFIGVAEDFNFQSAHEHIGDFAFYLNETPNRARFTHVRLHPGNLHDAMPLIQQIWEEHYPGQELSYFFLDEKIDGEYASEILLRKVLAVFSALALLISLLGMSAMALFLARQKTREIGIRRVHGASINRILVHLGRRFLGLAAGAFALAVLPCYLLMQRWLQSFAYRAGISWWIFALTGLLVLAVTLLTVALQSFRTASRNPVEALRYE
jgi:putative ABC transport system permease protein